jgi:hypothetical protein
MLIAVDQLPSPRCENAEASLSQGMSSLGKYFHYKGYDVPDINPDYNQEGAGRGIHPLSFNDGSDEILTDDEMPDMRQVIKGGPSTAEHTAAEVARLKAAASGIPPVIPAPITWPTWPLEEDPMVYNYVTACKEQGREINPQYWWHTCKLTDLCLQRVMAEMLANQESCSKEEHGIYRHVKKAQEATMKMKKGQGLESTVIFNTTAPEDIWKTITLWWCNSNGVPPAVCEDPHTYKLNVCDIDITLWVKVMAPSDKKEFRRFWDLVLKVFLLANSTSSLLGVNVHGSIGL